MQASEATAEHRSGRRGFRSPFSRYDDQVQCPHCGQHYAATEVEVVGEAGKGLKAVICPECRAHGVLPSD